MKNSTNVYLRTQNFFKRLPKLSGELCTTIWNNRNKNSMKSDYLLNLWFCWICGLYWQEMGCFSHTIYNYPNWIMLPARSCQARNEVYTNHISLPLWKSYVLSHTTWRLVFHPNWLAIWALNNEIYNASLLTIPPIELSQVIVHLCGTVLDWVSRIISFCHVPLIELIHLWYTQSTLIPQHTISSLFKTHYVLLITIYL